MLDSATDLANLQALLSEASARIVDGPMSNGGYVIAVESEDLGASLDALRLNEAVLSAEPLNAEVQP